MTYYFTFLTLAIVLVIAAIVIVRSVGRLRPESSANQGVLDDLAETIEWQDQNEPWRRAASDTATCMHALRNNLYAEDDLRQIYSDDTLDEAKRRLALESRRRW